MSKEQEVITNEVEQVEVEETETTIQTDVEEIAKEEPVVEQVETTEEKVEKGITEEELKKAIQSASSKAKNDILKEIGIESVADIRARLETASKYDEAVKQVEELIKERETLTSDKQELSGKAKKLEDALLINRLGVSEEFADDFIKLVDLDNSGKDRLEIAEALKVRFSSGNIFKGDTQVVKPIKIGNDKSEVEPTLKDRIKEMTKL